MAKYTDAQLKEMALDTLFAYHMGDQRADILIQMLSQTFQKHPQVVVNELNKWADKEISK